MLRNPFERQLLTIAEVSFATGFKKSTVAGWIHQGLLKRYGRPRHTRVNWDELAELMSNPPLPEVRLAPKPGPPKQGLKPIEQHRREISLMDAHIAGLKSAVRSGNLVGK